MSTDEDELPFRWSLFLPAPGDSPGMRVMKYAVIGMGVVLILGFMVIFARIVYLTSRMEASPPTSGDVRLALPEGTTIRSMALDQNRIALHLTGPDTAHGIIAIHDLATGRLISRIALDAGRAPTDGAQRGNSPASSPSASPRRELPAEGAGSPR